MSSLPESQYRVSVKGIAVDEDKVMLCYNNGTRDFPGGGINHDEHVLRALSREMHQELGVQVNEVEDSACYFLTRKTPDDAHIANVFYRMKLDSYDIRPSAECEYVQFFTKQEILDLGDALESHLVEVIENVRFVFEE